MSEGSPDWQGEKTLRDAVRCAIESSEGPVYPDVARVIDDELKRLYDEGRLNLPDDYMLSGKALEWRVMKLFTDMGFCVCPGRQGKEDFTVTPPADGRGHDPLVVEVKSSGKPNLARADLRQLDDWVFDLSGEERIRKYRGSSGWNRPRGRTVAYITAGLPAGPAGPWPHPSPHKGVMIFNGPTGTPFCRRSRTSINVNDEDFVKSRTLCVVPFGELVRWHEAYERGNSSVKDAFWKGLQETTGIPYFDK